MLSIQALEVKYGPKVAFSNVSLDVCQGDMVSIIGKSGCGKTSLLYAIAQLLEPSTGSIVLQGGNNSCSLMFQQDRLLPWKRVLDNVLLGLSKHHEKQACTLLSMLGLSDKIERYPNQLSGGERQRVALARCLIRRPRLLLLDEPFASLDEQTRQRLQDELKSYVQEHAITLLLVTHSIREAVFMGKRILVMTNQGFSYCTQNPYHPLENLRSNTDAFALEQELRLQLGSQS